MADNTDSVYVTAGALVKLKANKNGTEIAIAGGFCKTEHSPFRIFPDDEEMVDIQRKAGFRVNRILKADLIIIDEIGYTAIGRRETNLFLN